MVLNNDEYIFHAGTKNDNYKILSNGGRVLNFVILSKKFSECRKKALSLIDQINWPNGFLEKILVIKLLIDEDNRWKI